MRTGLMYWCKPDRSRPRTGARATRAGRFRFGRLPNLIFPMDRSGLVSTLWDDDWTCVGGPVALIDGFLSHSDLRARARRVRLDEDATPPGHKAV